MGCSGSKGTEVGQNVSVAQKEKNDQAKTTAVVQGNAQEKPAAAPAVGPPKIDVAELVEVSFNVATDLETTYKYNVSRTESLEIFGKGAEGGHGKVIDSIEGSWTIEKTDPDTGVKSYVYLKNEVLVENESSDKDQHFHDEHGNLLFKIHSHFAFT